jgi:hypothetical protein
MIKPLSNKFTFIFLDDIIGGEFESVTASGIVIKLQHETISSPRWGIVQEVGPKVQDFKSGEYVMIEALGWTDGMTVDDRKVWFSDDSKVIMVSEEPPEL